MVHKILSILKYPTNTDCMVPWTQILTLKIKYTVELWYLKHCYFKYNAWMEMSKWFVTPNHLFLKVSYPWYLKYSDNVWYLKDF